MAQVCSPLNCVDNTMKKQPVFSSTQGGTNQLGPEGKIQCCHDDNTLMCFGHLQLKKLEGLAFLVNK